MKPEIETGFERGAIPVWVSALDRPAFDRTQLCLLHIRSCLTDIIDPSINNDYAYVGLTCPLFKRFDDTAQFVNSYTVDSTLCKLTFKVERR